MKSIARDDTESWLAFAYNRHAMECSGHGRAITRVGRNVGHPPSTDYEALATLNQQRTYGVAMISAPVFGP